VNKKTVLIAEDNPSNMKLACDILESQGYNVIQAFDGEQAVNIAKQNFQLIDLILMDIQLPKISGFDVIKELKAGKATEKLPVFAVSAHAMEQEIVKARELGCIEYITKPINLADFIGKINRFLSSQ